MAPLQQVERYFDRLSVSGLFQISGSAFSPKFLFVQIFLRIEHAIGVVVLFTEMAANGQITELEKIGEL